MASWSTCTVGVTETYRPVEADRQRGVRKDLMEGEMLWLSPEE